MRSHHLVIDIEDVDDYHTCPSCGGEFDRDVWIDTGGYHYRSGGLTTYECPAGSCPGTVDVVI